jgi:predicted lipoprotein with Yx(FWY)xxD motif
MRSRKLVVSIVAVAVAAGVSGIAAAATSGRSAPKHPVAQTGSLPGANSPSTTPVQPNTTVRTTRADVAGVTEEILVDAKGLPLYTYQRDTAQRSRVTGALAAFWPPLVASNPTISGAAGKLTVSNGSTGTLVRYNGHFLYTFVNDSPGLVKGQGVQGFFVATPALAVIGSVPTSTPPATGSGGYGY